MVTRKLKASSLGAIPKDVASSGDTSWQSVRRRVTPEVWPPDLFLHEVGELGVGAEVWLVRYIMVTGGADEDEVSWSPSSDRDTLSVGRGEDEVSWSPSSHDRAFAAALPVIASILLLVPWSRCGY